MDEKKTMTYEEVLKEYGFSKLEAKKIIGRQKPPVQTEIEGIKALHKEGQRRAKLKAAYAKKRLEELPKKEEESLSSGESELVEYTEESVSAKGVTLIEGVEEVKEMFKTDKCNEIKGKTFCGYHPISGNPIYN